ncbi:MAG TPA: glycerol-3-phosphate dehydrogenase/oxidase [Gemmatimonadaceae bacterium]|nr:glycerol-3-phosphate dehydrogenase/oxidase [Gemmatimonadaceae bacterium]
MSVWERGWREALWDELAARRAPWDVIVVGGGVNGAGVFRECVRRGLSTLLLEANDFAWGTSSRSSKLVHGGVRYLTQGQWRVTREAVRERDRLAREAPGLVEPLRFVRALYAAERSRRWLFGVLFLTYDLFASRPTSGWVSAAEVRRRIPLAEPRGLLGGFSYLEAATDDARIVLRLLIEGVRAGGRALSYAPVESLLSDAGVVSGVRMRDAESAGTDGGSALELRARVVVNTTGAQADTLRGTIGAGRVIRPIRGSHLLFSGARFPLAEAIAWRHPADGRNVCATPWEGSTVLGTTEVEHADADPATEPRVSAAEASYLLAAANAQFPSLALAADDVISAWAGVRPVVVGGDDSPTKASRESMVVEERGLISVAGGKLTTFHATACEVMARLRERFPKVRAAHGTRAFDDVPSDAADHPSLDLAERARLVGRYGQATQSLVDAARDGELAAVPGTRTLWAELRWAARAEGVVHVDDLLLRRTRIGLLLEEGGAALLPDVRRVCQPELGWSDERWDEEAAAYRAHWRDAYAVPRGEGAAIVSRADAVTHG